MREITLQYTVHVTVIVDDDYDLSDVSKHVAEEIEQSMEIGSSNDVEIREAISCNVQFENLSDDELAL